MKPQEHLPSNWKFYRFGDIAKFCRELFRVEPTDTYKELSLRLYGKGFEIRREVSGSALVADEMQRMKTGQLVTSIHQFRNGAVGIVSPELAGTILSKNFLVYDLDSTVVDATFLLRFLTAPSSVFYFQANSTGSATPIFPKAMIEEVEIPLPALAEQRRVMARIEALAAQIHEARTLRHQAAEEAEAFVTSVHASLAGKRTKKLGEILKLDEDAEQIEATGSYPQVGVKSFGGGLFPKGPVEGTGTTYRAFNRLYDGALLLSQVKGWEGAVAVCPPELASWFVSPEYRTFRCVPSEARPKYLASLVRTEWFWGKLVNVTRGVGARRERTRPEQFLNIEMPMPDVEQQKQGEALFAEVDALKRLQAETAADLAALLPAILARAFKGEL